MRILIIMIILLGSADNADARKRRITFNDLYAYPMVGDIQLAPDGKNIIYMLTEYDTTDGNSSSALWMIDSKGGEPEKIIEDTMGVSHPRWSPDGKSIAYISRRDEKSQVIVRNLKGGNNRQATSISTGASGVEWSPDGEKLVFVSRVFPGCESDSCNKIRQERLNKRKSSGRLYTDLPVRHYNHWLGEKSSRLFIHDFKNAKTYSITPGEHNVPPIALAGGGSYQFSPDGGEICFVMNTDSSPELSTNNDLFIVSAQGGTYTRITDNPANDTAPHYSPDGKYIAYKAMSRPGFESDKNVLTLYNRKTGAIDKLTKDFPLSVEDIIWAPNAKEIYFTAIESGHVSIYKLSIKRRNIRKVLTGAVHWNFRLFPDNRRFCYIKIAADRPGEIYSYDMKNKTEVRLTYYTEDLFSKLDIQPPEHFYFEGAVDERIHGMLTYPPDFDDSRKYPLVLLIHGGPQWTWLDEFNYYGWNKYLVAARDYLVAQIDPHGSKGYGQDFTDAVSKDWGGKDYRDLMMGLDYLIAEHDFIDENRLAAMGRSYGGYMTNWIEGQTGRFECLVTVDGLFDLISAYYTTEELWFPEWEMGGPPWEDPRLYGERSPIAYLENFNTPMLIVHGQKDYRVDLSQALGMFTVLQRKGVDSQLLYFPDEGHSIHGMKNLEYFYEVQFDWLAKYLRGE